MSCHRIILYCEKYLHSYMMFIEKICVVTKISINHLAIVSVVVRIMVPVIKVY